MQRTTTQSQVGKAVRAHVYARFSSNLQSEASIEDQIRVCIGFIERQGWEMVRIHEDRAISGADIHRPGYQALLRDLDSGIVDVIVAESLDRLARDLGDMANLQKRVVYADARIVTVGEGEIGDLLVGVKGAMNALYRKDLADKVRRGQAGRVLAGKNAGGMAYGYHKVPKLEHGELVRGLRAINEAEAAIVRRIFREFIDGRSPIDIATRLNAEGIPSPSGGEWAVSTINGDRVRGNGILRNELYVGRVVHNKTRRVYDPETRRKRIRPNPPESWIVVEAPELRIVSDEQWAAVCARRQQYDGTRAEQQRRPRRLLSGLAFCGECGGAWTIRGPDRWGCSRHKQKGTCKNGRTITTSQFEARVLSGLEQNLLAPELVEEFVSEYRAAAAELAKSASREEAVLERRQRAAQRNKDRLWKAFMDGGREFDEIRDALAAAKAELAKIETQRADVAVPPVIALHPDLAGDYRRRVANLRELLQGGSDEARREALNEVRNLIDRIIVAPSIEARGVSIEIEGWLNAVLQLAAGTTPTASPAMYVNGGAAWGTRTHDPIITNDVLYQLS